MDRFKGHKTVLFNVLAATAMIVTLITGTRTEDDLIILRQGVEHLIEAIVAIWTIGNLWLRAVTDTPIFQRKPNASKWG
jgi:hypothetical protein